MRKFFIMAASVGLMVGASLVGAPGAASAMAAENDGPHRVETPQCKPANWSAYAVGHTWFKPGGQVMSMTNTSSDYGDITHSVATTWTVQATVNGEVSAEAGVVFSKASVKVGFELSTSIQKGTTITTNFRVPPRSFGAIAPGGLMVLVNRYDHHRLSNCKEWVNVVHLDGIRYRHMATCTAPLGKYCRPVQ